jgi:hypothetical protein
MFLFFAAVVMPKCQEHINLLAGKQVEILDLQFGFNPKQIYNTIARYGEAKDFYLKVELLADSIYPIVYTLALSIVLSTLLKKNQIEEDKKHFNLMPLTITSMDYLENMSIISLLILYPTQVQILTYLCATFTLLKWLFTIITILFILINLLKLATKKTNSI